MARRGENIYKRKDGRWEARIAVSGTSSGVKPRKSFYDSSYRGVKEKVQKFLLDGGKDNQCFYSTILQKWLDNKRFGIKESTLAKYSYNISKYIIPALGSYNVLCISTQVIEDYVGKLLCDCELGGLGLSSKSVRDILSIIKMTLDYAKQLGYAIPCDCSLISIKSHQENMRVLTVEEQTTLTQFLLDKPDLYKIGVLVSLYTGIRVGELCALKWGSINLKEQKISVRQTMQRISLPKNDNSKKKTKIVFSEPKSRCSIRDVPIPDFLIHILAAFQDDDDVYLLSGSKQKYVEPRTMQYQFGRYIAQCKIQHANYHALRHTFATRCIEVGFEIKSLSEVLGHASVTITLNRYVHSSFNLKLTNMNKLDLLQA